MSKEAAELEYEKFGYADLYYNDMHCLKRSFDVIKINVPKPHRDAEAYSNPYYEILTPLYRLATQQSKMRIEPKTNLRWL